MTTTTLTTTNNSNSNEQQRRRHTKSCCRSADINDMRCFRQRQRAVKLTQHDLLEVAGDAQRERAVMHRLRSVATVRLTRRTILTATNEARERLSAPRQSFNRDTLKEVGRAVSTQCQVTAHREPVMIQFVKIESGWPGCYDSNTRCRTVGSNPKRAFALHTHTRACAPG